MAEKSIFECVKNLFVLPNAHSEWEDYRKVLTDTVLKYGKKCSAKSVSIIGAGRCNDVDIVSLGRFFEKVFLVDYDYNAMMEALSAVPVEERDKFEVRDFSLTGLSEKDLSDFCDELSAEIRLQGENINRDSYLTIISKGLETIEKKTANLEKKLMEGLPECDVTVCNGVFSQLFIYVVYYINTCSILVSGYLPDDYMSITAMAEERLKGLNNKVIPIIAKAIREKAKKYAIFGNENSDSDPVEGAFQCIREIANSGHVYKERKAKWDFSRIENKRYDMLIQIVKNI